jgi:hypothetical protein
VICPACAVEFKGGSFYQQGERGRMRECPNGHQFKEPKKVRKQREPPHCPTCSCGMASAARAPVCQHDMKLPECTITFSDGGTCATCTECNCVWSSIDTALRPDAPR